MNEKLKKKIYEKYGSVEEFKNDVKIARRVLSIILEEEHTNSIMRICGKIDCMPKDVGLERYVNNSHNLVLKKRIFEKFDYMKNFAKEIGMGKRTLGRIVTNKGYIPYPENLRLICGYLKCSPEDLGYREDRIGLIRGDYKIIKNLIRTVKVKCLVCGRTHKKRFTTFKNNIGTSHKFCRQSIDYDDKFGQTWNNMRSRTTNPNVDGYKYYGGRGISSEEYKYMVDFYDDFYESYKEHCKKYGKDNTSIDRIDFNGDYTKDNIRWATYKVQANNRRENSYKAIRYDEHIRYFNDIEYFSNLIGVKPFMISGCLDGIFEHDIWSFEEDN